MSYMREPIVRLTHEPSGEVGVCTVRPSVKASRDIAMKVLRSRLWALQNGYQRHNPNQVIEVGELEDFSDASMEPTQ